MRICKNKRKRELEKLLQHEITARFEAEQELLILKSSITRLNAWIDSIKEQDTLCLADFNRAYPWIRDVTEKILLLEGFELISSPEAGWWRKSQNVRRNEAIPSVFRDPFKNYCYDEIMANPSKLVGKTLWEIDADNFNPPQVIESVITDTVRNPDSNEVYIAFHAKEDESRDNVLPLSEYAKKFFFHQGAAEESLGIKRI